MKKIKCAAAFLLAAAIQMGQLPAAWGAEPVITIRTAEDLEELSEKSVLDSYTKGKIFELAADINLSGSDFEPIASFGGTFRGNGHVISGFYWNQTGTDAGLFRFVEPEGIVENLIVDGVIRPEGSGRNVGGIAGTNRGRIAGCTFRGRLEGKENTGGIAGNNEAGGLIENCRNTSAVLGLDATGGIAGYNDGIVTGCTNSGTVNASEQITKGMEESSTLAIDGRKILDAEKVYHTGGIVGKSAGTVKESSNDATIGYPHAGYNTGGIAGTQSGYVDGCVNTGEVRGRKDTGGIVGQFEPYLQRRYEEDTIQKIQNQIEELIDQMDDLGHMTGDVSDDLLNEMDVFRSDMKEMRSSLQSQKHYYFDNTKEFSEELDQKLDRVENSFVDFELEFSDRNLEADGKDLKALVKRLKELREELKQALKENPEQAAEILEDMAETLEEIETTARDLPADLIDDVNNTKDQTGDQVDELKTSVQETRELIRENKDMLFSDLEATDEILTEDMDAISASLDALFDRLKTANTDTQNQMDRIRDQVKLISDTFDGRINELQQDDRELVDDVSGELIEEPGNGLVSKCENRGLVQSDSNTGGIVGIIGRELKIDPENDLEIDGDQSLRIDRTARASIYSCTNREQVISTNDYAGGIAGRADAGALSGNRNFGDVTSQEGSYVGGIAGSSGNIVRDNYVLCRLDGADYIGGAAGDGKDVTGNCVMVSVGAEEPGEYRGAVAGYADGAVSGNYFVKDGLPAVNGVTYEEQAKPLGYQELTAMEGVPAEFRNLSVSYYADDTLIKTVPVRYGMPVPEKKIPEIPEKDGYYAYWEDRGQEHVTGNLRIRAQYRMWETSIESALTEDEVPVMLAEGQFYPDTKLHVEVCTDVPKRAEGSKVVKGYRVSLQAEEEAGSLTRLRLHTPKKEKKWFSPEPAAAILRADGTTIFCDARQEGSYLVISVPEEETKTEMTLLLLEKK